MTAWRNDGTGRLVESWSQTFEHENFAGTEPFAVGDVSGDGLDDFVIVISRTVRLYASDRFGGFAPYLSWTEDEITGEVRIADFDGNGFGDVAILNFGEIAVHRHLGHGIFDKISRGGVFSSSLEILVAEVSGDSNPDIVLWDDRELTLYPIVGDTIFETTSFSHFGDHVAAGDIDGDEDIDLVAFGDTQYWLFRRAGPGLFEAEAPHVGGPAAKLADIDGDGDLDGICCGGGGGPRYNDDPSTFHLAFNDDGVFAPAFTMQGLGSREIAGAVDNEGLAQPALDLALTARQDLANVAIVQKDHGAGVDAAKVGRLQNDVAAFIDPVG